MTGGYTPARNALVANLITNTDQYPSNGMTECGKDCRDCEQSARVEDVGKIECGADQGPEDEAELNAND